MDAGPGKVIGRVIAPTGQPAEVQTVQLPNGKVNVCYTPQMLGDHMVEILFGGQVIPGGRFNQKVSLLKSNFSSIELYYSFKITFVLYFPGCES